MFREVLTTDQPPEDRSRFPLIPLANRSRGQNDSVPNESVGVYSEARNYFSTSAVSRAGGLLLDKLERFRCVFVSQG